MTDVTRPNSDQAWITPTNGIPVSVSSRYTDFIWPTAIVVLGVVSTFAWITFLGWCVVSFVL
jgi:hypothetical protein